jgi:Condensation domain
MQKSGPAYADELLPLSAEQEAFLGNDRNGHGAVPICFRVRGELDLGALQRALAWVVARHDVLRMRLVDTPDGLRQMFLPDEAQAFVIQQISAADGLTAAETAAGLAAEPNDLRTHGPVRAWLIGTGSDDQLVLMSIDHMAFDAWSIWTFSRELWTCYQAELSGTEPELPPAYQYASFVATQQRVGPASWPQAQHDYWRRVSREYCVPACAPQKWAPVDPADRPGRSDIVCNLGPEETAGLTEFARVAMVPPRTVELAGPLLAFWALCPAPVIGIWCTHATREDPAVANAIGLYVRVFPLVVQVDPAATLTDFSRTALREWSEAVSQSAMPYAAADVRRMIAEAGGPDPMRPDIRLNRITPPRGRLTPVATIPISDSTTLEFCDLEAARWTWYREPRLRLMSSFGNSLSMRAIFNPGMMPPEFPEEMMANLDMVLSLFVTEHADRPIGELVKLAGLSK